MILNITAGMMVGAYAPLFYIRHICQKIRQLKENGQPIEPSKEDQPSAKKATGATLSFIVVAVLIIVVAVSDEILTNGDSIPIHGDIYLLCLHNKKFNDIVTRELEEGILQKVSLKSLSELRDEYIR